MSAEVQGDVSEALGRARKKVKDVINAHLAEDYGPALQEWVLITILRPQIPVGWGEICQYHKSERMAEFRLVIDHGEFKAAPPGEQIRLLVKSILRSIDLFPRLLITEFDIDRFRCDVMEAALRGGLTT